MNLLVDYVHPLTNWLQNNPNWSLFITFLVSLAESLAIVGSIVPGSITMTAIGILAGSGIMRLDLTLIAAILGAVAGDSLSYIIGYYYSDRLLEIWPFSKYPKLLQYGKDFFKAHGGKSVLIGRFVGPLRSIIPVIAGILHMKQWRFFLANLLSAIGWSLLYVIPGFLIGTASHELSTKDATNLFLLILFVLVVIWSLSLIIKWLIKKLYFYLELHLHDLWMKFKNNSRMVYFYNTFTPTNEINHFKTASLVFITTFCFICFIVLLVLTLETNWLYLVNNPTNIFFRSFNTVLLKLFFIYCTQLTSVVTIIIFSIICCFYFIYHKNYQAIIYLISLLFLSGILAFTLALAVPSPRPTGILIPMSGSSFPVFDLVVATALYSFILFYITNTYSLISSQLKTIIFTILGFSGLGLIYLGDNWLTDVLASYFCGATISLIHCLIYRKSHFNNSNNSLLMILPLLIGVFLSALLSTYFNYQLISYKHTLYYKEFSLPQNTWWSQNKPLLPIYQMSRIGKRISLLNIQYAGDLDSLEQSLKQNGWIAHNDTFVTNLLMRISKQPNKIKFPLLSQLYDNKPPMLIMTYDNHHDHVTLELRIWESNYNLIELNQPLWIGSVHPSIPIKKQLNEKEEVSKISDPIPYMFKHKNQFTVKELKLQSRLIKNIQYPTYPYIILIREKNSTE